MCNLRNLRINYALTPPETSERSHAALRTLAVAFAGFCAFMPFYATQPLLPLLQQVFHASKAAVSLTITLSTVGVALFAPVIGSIADRLGRKRVIVWCASMLALLALLSATATTLRALISWRFLQGVFTPGVFAVTVAYVQEEWPRGEVGHAMAAYVTGTVLGGFTSRFMSGLVANYFNWHWSFVVLGLMGAVGAAVLGAGLPRERNFLGLAGSRMPQGLQAARDHLRNKRLLATYAAGSCVLFSLLGTFTYVTFYLAAAPFHLSPKALGSLFFVYLIGAVITPPCGRFIDRYGHRLTLACAIGAGIIGVLLTLSHNFWLVAAGLTLVCTGVFVGQSAANSYIGVAAARNKALAVGLYVMFYYAGGSAGAFLPAYAWALGGWPACVALFALVQAITVSIALAWWTPPAARERRQSADYADYAD